jgi:putative ABC transport system ATP-binding protein
MGYIKAEHLKKQYGSGHASFAAVKGMSFEIHQGEFIAVTGESGSGKTTLLTMMGALNSPTSGRYFVDDMDIYALRQEQRSEFRREYLGFVFQSFYLIPYLNVLENVMLPLVIGRRSNAEKRAMAAEALARVGLEGKERRLPAEISGGEQERAAIARAIVNEPTVLLADEPTGNLDTRTSGAVMDLFQELNRGGMTIVMVTHSRECSRWAERVLMISDGLLVGEAPNFETPLSSPGPGGLAPAGGIRKAATS